MSAMVFHISRVTVVVISLPVTVVGSGTGTTMALVVGSILLPDLRIAEQQVGSFTFPLQIHFMRLGLTSLSDLVPDFGLDCMVGEPVFELLDLSCRIVDLSFELLCMADSRAAVLAVLMDCVADFFMLGLILVTLVDTLVAGIFLLGLSRWLHLDGFATEAGLLGRTLVTVVVFLAGRLALLGLPSLADLDVLGSVTPLVGLTLWSVVATVVRGEDLVFSLTDKVLR